MYAFIGEVANAVTSRG